MSNLDPPVSSSPSLQGGSQPIYHPVCTYVGKCPIIVEAWRRPSWGRENGSLPESNCIGLDGRRFGRANGSRQGVKDMGWPCNRSAERERSSRVFLQLSGPKARLQRQREGGFLGTLKRPSNPSLYQMTGWAFHREQGLFSLLDSISVSIHSTLKGSTDLSHVSSCSADWTHTNLYFLQRKLCKIRPATPIRIH